jgi:N-acetylglucosamine-6-sulfatase
MDRRKFIKTVSAASANLPFLMNAESRNILAEKFGNARQRNIIFILSDDHRYDFMGFLDKPKFLETPNMDRMAREGAHVDNASVTTSLCSPSRATILTGLYSHKHKVIDNGSPVPEGTKFIGEYLQRAGYETAFIGKWHMGEAKDDPRAGFDHWVSFKGQGLYYNPDLNVDGQRIKSKGYVSDILTDYAIKWLKKKRNKPFFLFLSHKAVHAMFEPAQRHLGKYDKVELEYPANMANTEENYKNKPRWVREQRNSWHGVDFMYHGSMDFDTFYRRYCETILGIDDSIGVILNTLGELELDKSTLLFYMSDNGFCFGEHGLIDKRHMYEPSMRVPLLVRCPEMIKPGIKIDKLVQNIDIAPTIFAAAGLKPLPNMDGKSLLPLLQGKDSDWRNEVYYEYYWERDFPHTPTVFGVRTEKYKYMTYHGIWDIDELYDLKNDPDEMYNLITKADMKDIIIELRNKVFTWLKNTNGMQIPLKHTGLRQFDKRNPDLVK